MATPGIINGTNLMVYVVQGANIRAMGYSTSCTLSVSHDTRSTTNSVSGGWQSRMAGDRDWEVSVDAFVSMVGNPTNPTNQNFYSLYTAYIENRIMFLLKFGNAISGDYYYEGDAFMSSFEISAANEESTTYSMSFVAAGPLTQSQN